MAKIVVTSQQLMLSVCLQYVCLYVRYGMINQVVYDVFKKDEDDVVGEDGLSGTCIYKDNKDFTEKGLKFW